MRRFAFVAITIAISLSAWANSPTQPPKESPKQEQGSEILKRVKELKGFTDLSQEPFVKLDIRYATENNFMKRDVYGDYKACVLHDEAAAKFKKAGALLSERKPGWKFLVFDCLRPRSIQRILWSYVKGTPEESYVANPDTGSIHNYGFAIDLSLVDEKGNEVDMGTPYDFFGDKAQPRHEAKFLKSGELTQAQLDNRKILRAAMTDAGFIQIPNEWWHYDGKARADLKKKYKIVE